MKKRPTAWEIEEASRVVGLELAYLIIGSPNAPMLEMMQDAAFNPEIRKSLEELAYQYFEHAGLHDKMARCTTRILIEAATPRTDL